MPTADVATTPAAPRARSRDERREQRNKDAEARRGTAPKRQEIRSIETELAALDYARNAAHARKVTERHATVRQEIEQLETRWLELSERLESD